MHDRIPPQNLEAEMAVLGAILVDADLYDVVAEHIDAADFYAHVHESIFLAMGEMRKRKAPMDKIALAEELRRRGDLENVGGLSYLSSLMDTVQTAASAEYYAKIIAEKSGLRHLIQIGTETTRRGYEDEEIGPVEVANLMTSKIESAVLLRRVKSAGLVGPAIARELEADWMAKRARRLFTPWGPLNRGGGSGPRGFGVRELTIWAGHPKQGKTTLLLNLADFLARRYGREIGPVAYWPLEMGRIPTNYKMLSMYTGIDATAIQERVDLTDEQMAKVRCGMRMRAELPLVMFDRRPMLDIPNMRLQLRKMKRETGLCAAIVDHVGWFDEVRRASSASEVHTRQERIFQECAEIADDLEIAMHLVMHLKRPKDMPADGNYPRPSMFDLRGGGNPEGHAHTIAMVWRPDPKTNPNNGAVIIEAARSGGEGTYFLDYQGARSLWLDPHDTTGYGGLWFPPATASAEDMPRIALPYKDAADEEDGGYYGTEDFPQERPDFLDEDGGLADEIDFPD